MVLHFVDGDEGTCQKVKQNLLIVDHSAQLGTENISHSS